VIKFPFIPKEAKFFDLFEQSAQNMVKTAQALKKLVHTCNDVGGSVAVISELEHQGDIITHQIIAQLHRTFVTPFDREDIVMLAQSLDDVTDLIHAAADAMFIYKIAHPAPRALELADIILQAAVEVEKAMPQLRSPKEMKQMLPRCVEINRLENEADRRAFRRLYRHGAYHQVARDIRIHGVGDRQMRGCSQCPRRGSPQAWLTRPFHS